MIARMWECRAEPGRTDEVVRWLVDEVVPAAEAAGGSAEVFRSEDRAVLVTRWEADRWVEPAPPPGLVARSHAWPFEVVRAALRGWHSTD